VALTSRIAALALAGLILVTTRGQAQSWGLDADRDLPVWLRSWSALRSTADLPHRLPGAGTASSAFLFGPPRTGLFWTAGNPANLASELADARTDFTFGWGRQSGDYRRPLDPEASRLIQLQALSWKPVSPRFSVLGRVLFDQDRYDPGTRADRSEPFGSSPFVTTDTSATPVRRTRALLEGAGGWRAGAWTLGATLGFEARDHTTILSGVLRRNRLVTPGIVLGVARKMGGIDAGIHARYRYRSETIRVIEVSEEARVYDLIGYRDPPALNLQPDYYRRREEDALALGVSLAATLGSARLTLFAEQNGTGERLWNQETNDPVQDHWDANGLSAGVALSWPISASWLLSVNGRYASLDGEADRGTDSAGVVFTADESVVEADAEIRFNPTGTGWTGAMSIGVVAEDRDRTDLVLALPTRVNATTPRVQLEAGHGGERLFIAVGGSLAGYRPDASIPDPASRGPQYRYYYAPEFGLYATDAGVIAGTLLARYRVARAASLWLNLRTERRTPSSDGTVIPLAPVGSRSATSLMIGATLGTP
jgi:hypothetical protein